MKIMIVEDNPDISSMYQMAFSSQGHEVTAHHDGLDAITHIADYEPDLILLDLMMPEMDGFSFLNALKNNTSSQSKVIVVSNLSDEQSIERAKQYSCVLGYLKKSDYTPQTIVEEALKIYQSPNDSSATE
jgi:DNA-binding response OmpR family regulator